MKLFKNSVGRPSNETKKKRRLFIFGTVTLSVAAGLLVALLISSISINNLSGKALGNYSGDVDGDGLVTQKDVQKILKFSSRLEKYTAAELKIADMNKDGKITQKDALMAKKVAAKNYTIIFNNSRADNGSGKMESVEVGKNGTKLPKCKFTDKGKIFKGWIMQRNQDGKYYGKIDNKDGWYTSDELFKGKKNGVYLLLKDESALNPLTKKVKAGTKVTLYATWEDAKKETKANSNKSKKSSKSSSKNNSKNTTTTTTKKRTTKKTQRDFNCPAKTTETECRKYSNCQWALGKCKTL